METRVFAVTRDGMRITLTNGTVWTPVDDVEMLKACHWNPAAEVDLAELAGGEYLLINHCARLDETVRVREAEDTDGDTLLYA